MNLLILAFLFLTAIGSVFADAEDFSNSKLHLFGGLGKLIKKGVGAVGKIAGAAAPIIGLLPGGGAINAGLGAIKSFGGTVGKIASVALPALTALSASRQAGADTEQSRFLAQQATDLATQNAQRANEEFAAGSPLRDAFRSGALNFFDPTNPFAIQGGGGIAGAAAPVAGPVQGGPPSGAPPEVVAGIIENAAKAKATRDTAASKITKPKSRSKADSATDGSSKTNRTTGRRVGDEEKF